VDDMTTTEKLGTARWHLTQAGVWLAAAQTIWDDGTPTADKAANVTAMAAMSQAHAALGTAIEAHPTIQAIWTKPE
jgi:hypothetical protein